MLTVEIRGLLARARCGLTAAELADKLGRSRSEVRRVAAGMARRDELLVIEDEPTAVYALPQDDAPCA